MRRTDFLPVGEVKHDEVIKRGIFSESDDSDAEFAVGMAAREEESEASGIEGVGLEHLEDVHISAAHEFDL